MFMEELRKETLEDVDIYEVCRWTQPHAAFEQVIKIMLVYNCLFTFHLVAGFLLSYINR